MNIPFLQAMRVDILRRVPARGPIASTSFTAEPPSHGGDTNDREYRASCELRFTVIKAKDAEDYVRREAARVFTQHLYGEIRSEIHKIRQDIYLRDHDGAMARVSALLRDLD